MSNENFRKRNCKYRTFLKDYRVNNKGTREEEAFINSNAKNHYQKEYYIIDNRFASGYIAESAVPFDIDIAHKCDKPGLDRCYDLGLQAGLFDGYQYHGHLL
jgi:hypothetical protein